MNLENLYREVIMEHHQHPFARAPLAEVDASAHGYNASCGDEFTVNLKIEDGKIAGIQVDGHGCAISSAAGSMLGQAVVGMTLDEVRSLIDNYRSMLKSGDPDKSLPGDMPALAGVSKFPVRIKCASLPMTTTLDALNQLL